MMEQRKSSFWDRAVRNLRSVWGKIGATDNYFLEASFSPELNEIDQGRLIGHMRACLEARGGEVSARSRAAALGHAYLALNETGRKRFLGVLASEFGSDTETVNKAISDLQNATNTENRMAAEKSLREALVSTRTRLLTQFNALPEGVKFLVDMRAELIPWARNDPFLNTVECDLKALLTSWFDVGFLELKQITWKAPAALLEKFFGYEAVHEITGWDDLKNRLASDRRCFAFFHPRMPEEPLVFVWVALVEGMASNIHELLDKGAPDQDEKHADTAIFYSISNAQAGLSGITFGNFLIKRVVDNLSAELDGLKKFATLSPIPGFMPWLRSNLENNHLEFLTIEQQEKLKRTSSKGSPKASLIHLLYDTKWVNNTETQSMLKPILLRLAVHYLANEKRNEGTALDSVAHFHLNNGARIEQLHWAADLSPKGIKQSAGIMLNYLYLLKDIEVNHESYRSGKAIMTSSDVRDLLKDQKPT